MMDKMNTQRFSSAAGRTDAAGNAVTELIGKLKAENDESRTQAWFQCGPLGVRAIPPLAALWADAAVGLEVRRAARRALAQIVRYAARPEAGEEKRAVLTALRRLVEGDGPPQMRRELLWLLSEIAGEESLSALRQLLTKEAVREEACMALERIPGNRSLKALEGALAQAPADFKPVLAAALARRGREVRGVPTRRLVPAAQTRVGPLSQP